jgi:hypothetical protein
VLDHDDFVARAMGKLRAALERRAGAELDAFLPA